MDPPGPFEGLLGVIGTIKVGRGQIFGAVERELAVPPELFGDPGQLFDVRLDLGRQSGFIILQDIAHIVRAGRFNAADSEEALEAEFDDLLSLPHDIGVAFPFIKHLKCCEPVAGPRDVIKGEFLVLHPV